MAKKESNFFNMVLTLFLVTFFASTALGYVYQFTKEPIAEAKLNQKVTAIKNVVPGFDNNPYQEKFKVPVKSDSLTVFPAKKNKNITGYGIETFTNKGFSGEIKLMVGFKTDGTIQGISVLEHQETPGLGDKIESTKSDFSAQFVGKDPDQFKLDVRKDGGEVDAITASTISSRAFCDAVERAHQAYKQIKNK